MIICKSRLSFVFIFILVCHLLLYVVYRCMMFVVACHLHLSLFVICHCLSFVAVCCLSLFVICHCLLLDQMNNEISLTFKSELKRKREKTQDLVVTVEQRF